MNDQESLQLRPVSEQEVSDLIAEEGNATHWPWTEALLIQSIESGHQCQGAYIGHRKVGYCVLFNNTEALEILNLVVFADYHRRGIGRKILDAIRLQAASLGLAEIWLEVREDNIAAITLYRSDGFIERGRRTGYYRNNNPSGDRSQARDAVLMSRPVNLHG